MDWVAGCEDPCGAVHIGDGRQPDLAKDDRAVREVSTGLHDNPDDLGERGEPAGVDRPGDQDDRSACELGRG